MHIKLSGISDREISEPESAPWELRSCSPFCEDATFTFLLALDTEGEPCLGQLPSNLVHIFHPFDLLAVLSIPHQTHGPQPHPGHPHVVPGPTQQPPR